MYTQMVFEYEEVMRNVPNQEIIMSIDDLALYPPVMVVQVNGKDVSIGDEDEGDIVHISFEHLGHRFAEDKKRIYVDSKLHFAYTEEAGHPYAIECALDNADQIERIIKEGKPCVIVPYTEEIYIKGLHLVAMEFFKREAGKHAEVRVFTNCDHFDIEQFEEDEE